MTTLLLDMGNTNLKWGLVDEQGFTYGGACPVQDEFLISLFQNDWSTLLPETVLVASVQSNDFQQLLGDQLEANWGRSPEFIIAGKQACGVKNSYAKPETMGSDRWVAMLSAFNLIKGPVCVVSCGTAITVDVVDKQGQHRGGLILPGYDLMQQSLQSGTAMEFNTEEIESRHDLLGQSTDACTAGGIRGSVSALVERVYHDRTKEMTGLQLILTGGGAQRLSEDLSISAQIEPYLILKGLALMHQTQLLVSTS